MLALIGLYRWTLLAGAIVAPALALLGTHLAARDRSLQTLCISQGSLLGVLLGMVAASFIESAAVWLPFAAALGTSAATYLVTERLVAYRVASRNTSFAFVFSLLLASGYLISAVFPSLENHLTQIYFGDLATLSTSAAQQCAIAFSVACAVLIRYWRPIANGSFEWALFGEGGLHGAERGFRILALWMLCLSVQCLGFLFTITLLFLPTAMMRHLRRAGLRRHFILCASLASVGTVTGFLLSLQFTRLPTVPTIAWTVFVFAVAVLTLERLWDRARYKQRSERSRIPIFSQAGPDPR